MDDERSPIWFHLVLHRIDPGQGIRRFYSLMIKRICSGPCAWCGTGAGSAATGQELTEIFASEFEAGEALEAVARAKEEGDQDL